MQTYHLVFSHPNPECSGSVSEELLSDHTNTRGLYLECSQCGPLDITDCAVAPATDPILDWLAKDANRDRLRYDRTIRQWFYVALGGTYVPVPENTWLAAARACAKADL